MLTQADVDRWSAYRGRSEVRRQLLDVESLRRFAAAVGADLDVERRLPPIAHWAFFLEAARADGLGADGHPLRDAGLLPPVTLPRRMFASAAMRFTEPLVLGKEAQMTLTVADVKHRAGKTGDLVFVEVDRVVTQEGRERLSERQTLVYRDAGGRVPAVEPFETHGAAAEADWTPGPVDLFRFSAATFNSHRIHYDLPYARDEEGYPDLVVQGPFTAVKLYDFAARAHPTAAARSFSFRASAPLFAGQPVRLAAGAKPGEVEAVRCDGAIAMTAVMET